MKLLVIPDVHLKPQMFDRAAKIMNQGNAERAVCLMDIPDDWGQEYNLDLYNETFDRAVWFQRGHLETLWCYGNHDLSYVWNEYESGFSAFARETVTERLEDLKAALPDEGQLAYIHRVDNVLFLHGGLTKPFVKYYAADIYDDTDAVVCRINSMGRDELWDEASPIWYRPQYGREEMYKSDELLQVVGHTPVQRAEEFLNVLSCDVFSTTGTGFAIGDQSMIVVDTETLEWHRMV